jgi:hypothetical protein
MAQRMLVGRCGDWLVIGGRIPTCAHVEADRPQTQRLPAKIETEQNG